MNDGVSVIVPTFKRLKYLRRCLHALLKQNFCADNYEIIVCDDAASSDVEEYCRRRQCATKVSIKYIPVVETEGPAGARNAGLTAARYEIVAFIDDDCVADIDWLRRGAEKLDDSSIAAVTGRVVVPLPEVPTDYELDMSRLQQAEFVTANLFCRKQVLLSLGGFDTSFRTAWREDSELYFRFLELQLRVEHEPAAVVTHPIRPGRWGVSLALQKKSMFNALLYKKHPILYRQKKISEPPLHYYFIVISFLVLLVSVMLSAPLVSMTAAAVWLYLTFHFFSLRIKNTSRHFLHLLEMALTSILIPFLSVFWRLCGAVKYRVWFA